MNRTEDVVKISDMIKGQINQHRRQRPRKTFEQAALKETLKKKQAKFWNQLPKQEYKRFPVRAVASRLNQCAEDSAL
mgnify:CR=1 FL=1